MLIIVIWLSQSPVNRCDHITTQGIKFNFLHFRIYLHLFIV